MLRARLENGLFVLGLTEENVKRLKEGQPIVIPLAEMGGHDDVVIMYGKDIEDLKKQLTEATGSPLPALSTLNQLRNPN